MHFVTHQPEKTIDLRGLRCPNLVICIIKALDQIPPGTLLQITTDDLNAPSNIAAWCRQSEHELIEVLDEDGRFIFFIRKTL